MKNSNESIGELISLKDNDYLTKQRVAGKVAREALDLLENLVKEKSSLSLLEMSRLAEEYILQNNCTPTFKGYKGFPETVCCSVNTQVVHAIPTDYKLQDGDLISFDLGATYEGVIADTARTHIFGNPKSEKHVELVKATREALDRAISSIRVGLRIGVIGNTIYRCAKKYGFAVNENYGGHGLSISKPHDFPFIGNKTELEEGIRIQPGLSIAIEPILTMGSKYTRVAEDKWSVIGDGISAHAEHTVFVHPDRVEVIT